MAAQIDNKNLPKSTFTEAKAENTGPVEAKIEPEKTLYMWKAPSRPFKRRSKQFWMTTIAIGTIFGLVMFLAEGALPVILIVSIIFLVYVYSTVEPEIIEYQITNQGIKIQDKGTDWGQLVRFWFSRRFDNDLLVFQVITFPERLEVVINSKDKDPIKKILSKYLSEEEIPPSSLDRAASWFAKRMPGN